MPPESRPPQCPVLDDAFMQDPHSTYAVLRGQAPVHRAVTGRGLPVWLVTRYAEAKQALIDPRLSKDAMRMREVIDRHLPAAQPRVTFDSSLSKHMLNSDPPDHTRLRKLVATAFTTRRVKALRPRIEQITAALLEGLANESDGDGVVDLLDGLAFPLPTRVICELLGVQEDDRADFRSWSNIIVSQGRPETVGEASQHMSRYLTGLIDRRRRAPGEDLLSGLIEATDDGARLDVDELVSMVFLLLVAGHETTVNLIGNGVHALLSRPDQWSALREDPSLVTGAVEEVLRYDGPVNMATFRHTAEPVTLGGVDIPAGELVLVSLSAANRDGERFTDPDSFDVTRTATGHLAFGHGVHFCVGAPLTRLEGETALRALARRYPGLAPAVPLEELRWRNSTLMRGLERFPVRLE